MLFVGLFISRNISLICYIYVYDNIIYMVINYVVFLFIFYLEDNFLIFIFFLIVILLFFFYVRYIFDCWFKFLSEIIIFWGRYVIFWNFDVDDFFRRFNFVIFIFKKR